MLFLFLFPVPVLVQASVTTRFIDSIYGADTYRSRSLWGAECRNAIWAMLLVWEVLRWVHL